MIRLENDELVVEIDEHGGRLASIQGKENGVEYLWQGMRFPNMFPFVGRLHEQKYTLEGATYPMPLHGFLREYDMDVVERQKNGCRLRLTDNEATREAYPYAFAFDMVYALAKNRVDISFEVENHTDRAMYCAMGGHPGFNVPLEAGLAFEDYDLLFPIPCRPRVCDLGEAVLDTGKRKDYPLVEDVKLPLRHDMFQHDAIVLAQTPGQVLLGSGKGKRWVQVDYPHMPYVGVWQRSQGEPSFVCIEPWSGLPGRENVVEDLATMPDRVVVPARQTYGNRWAITLW